ncbi:uncharacterized protein [Euphorbia lathyris]|uniref:uncharacterized protein n=1 Tax=Euphorbia lathyris TaxID=212925 RepID=UPI00331343BF
MSTCKDKSNDSLCEKSMKMVVNIIKLSSFSIAKMSLGVVLTEPSLVNKNLTPVTGSVMVTDQPEIPAGSRKSSQQMRSRSKPYSFVMQKADEEKGSTYMIREGNSLIDGMASDYIKKFHEKNSRDREHEKSKRYRPCFPSRTVKIIH